MKKYSSLVYVSAAFLFYCCNKDNEVTSRNDNSIIQNPTSYLLVSEVWSGPATNGESFSFSYNDENLISKIGRYQWETYSVNGGTLQTSYDSSYYDFEYTNGLATKVTDSEKTGGGSFIYEYNGNHLPIKRTTYNVIGDVQDYSFYKYDDHNNLVEKTDSDQAVEFRYIFTYDSANHLVSVIDSILWSSPKQKMKYEWTDFDDKVNFIQAVNGLPPTFVWDNNYGAYSSSSPNNFLSQNYFIPVNVDQPFTAPFPTSYFYEYNDEGLPLKMYDSPWTVAYQYKKYK